VWRVVQAGPAVEAVHVQPDYYAHVGSCRYHALQTEGKEAAAESGEEEGSAEHAPEAA
jgi:hypothetical protein